MPDENGGSATGSTPQSGQPNSAPNADVVSIPRSEYDKLARYGDQVKGFQPYREKAAALGFKSAEDFDAFAPKHKTISELEKKGWTVDRLARLLGDEADDDVREKETKGPQFDPAKFEQELLGKFRKESAQKEYESLTAKEKDHYDAVLRDVLGDEKVDDMGKFLYRQAIENLSWGVRENYPKDHPLAGMPEPFGEKHAAKLVEQIRAEKAKYAGASMKDKADAALQKSKQAPPSTAGRSGRQGEPTKNKSNGLPTREQLEEVARAVVAKRGG